jgi:hypothetical protein
MLHNYEKLIANPRKHKSKWEGYGSAANCMICKVQDTSSEIRGLWGCTGCPLDCPDNNRCGDLGYPAPATLGELENAFETGDDLQIMAAAQVRYESLIACINSKGWKYE